MLMVPLGSRSESWCSLPRQLAESEVQWRIESSLAPAHQQAANAEDIAGANEQIRFPYHAGLDRPPVSRADRRQSECSLLLGQRCQQFPRFRSY